MMLAEICPTSDSAEVTGLLKLVHMAAGGLQSGSWHQRKPHASRSAAELFGAEPPLQLLNLWPP